MREIRTLRSMSGERKRSDGSQSEPQATAPLLDSTIREKSAARSLQLRWAMRSSLLLRIQERPRNANSIAASRPDDASLMNVSETWGKA